MASSSKESFSIEKLNSSNYAVWFKIEMILMKEDLYSHITDNPPDPITAKLTKGDNKARAIINLTFQDS